ncbi:MAG TPA: prolyl oligopeptidase family serine peptidase [Longimicrobiales bacterium]|nr:prolyl oligopeptidase family serine peptidase [Longimicrobiales bacterium]
MTGARPRRRPFNGRRAASIALGLAVLASAASAQEPYRQPPQVIVDILDAPPLPGVSVSPDREWLLLQERSSMPTIEDMAEPILRIAGTRINPARNSSAGIPRTVGLRVKSIDGRTERAIRTPANAIIGWTGWSPDGQRIAFLNMLEDRVELWVAEAATGEARRVTDAAVNAIGNGACQWMDGTTMLCGFVPDGRGAPPQPMRVPTGPTTQESSGRAAPVRTYQDLLSNAYDVALFEYYFPAQLAFVDVTTGARTPVGNPGIFAGVDPSPSGEFVLVRRIVQPYSYQVPMYLFPQEIEVWNRSGAVAYRVASQPLLDNLPPGGWVQTGPRSVSWRPAQPATLYWAEALDGGNPRADAEYRDRIMMISAPFSGEPRELARTGQRFAGIDWAERDVALISDMERAKRWRRTWVFRPDQPSAEWRLLHEYSTEDAYNDPGSPIMRTAEAGNRVLLQRGNSIYLEGRGAGPEGDHPFVDRLDLNTLRTQRVWQSEKGAFESPVALLDDDARRILTRRETPTDPPNYFVRDTRNNRGVALTDFEDPAPQLRGLQKQLVTYERADGVPLNGTLYLPPDYREGQRLPVVVWAYPREYVNADVAGQVRSSANRFDTFNGASHLFFLTQGYAVFDGPSMPIIGGDTANNSYVEQLVASAQAAVDKVVEMGIADPDRIGVGGHSYGAFMTANLLAHSDVFRAGIARSGAYNRTLTPFGFQSEQRTFWEAPDLYARMSPFWYADEINEPILLIHGEADNNSGTFPVQSERMFAAVKGHGGTVRLVMLPHESHGYLGRESVLHALAEMVGWFDKYVKNAPPRERATSQQ